MKRMPILKESENFPLDYTFRVAKEIAERRKRYGLTQKELSILTDVSETDIARMEMGDRSIGKNIYVRVVGFLTELEFS